MHQDGCVETEEMKAKEQIKPMQSRGRSNSKLKVLVRSHAMREEASPPRDPAYLSSVVTSPYIKLIPSPNSSPCQSPSPTITKPMVVLSPSISRGNSPCRSPLHVSVSSNLAPSKSLSSSSSSSSSSKNSLSHSSENLEKLQSRNYHTGESENAALKRHSSENYRTTEPNPDETSWKNCEETNYSNTQSYNRKFFRNEKNNCDCTSHTCSKCLKNHERNINNNINSTVNNNASNTSNTLTVNRSARGTLRQQSSSLGSFEGSLSNSPCLSRDSSSEQYTDTTGVDLEQFISETLNRNAKDRALMLRIEQELVNLAKDKIKTHYKFPPMSSYQRMLVHRCAAYFGMDHNIESSGKCVVVNKTKNTRIPDVPFKEYVKEDIVFVEEPRRSILKRDSSSIEDYSFKSPDRHFTLENRRSKSFEEREEEYERARRRIFNRDLHQFSSTEELEWTEAPWSSTDSDCSSRFRLLHPGKHSSRLLKVQSVESASDMPRPCVAKSYSFGGYGGGVSVLTRDDSVLSTHSAGPRLLTKQDSGASSVSWRLSPSSSGYKSQSQVSDSVTPSPASTPNLSIDPSHRDSSNRNLNSSNESAVPEHVKEGTESHLIWAVSDIHEVPKGSIIINPQTGQPVKNCDGSIYHYDPSNPPPDFDQLISNISNKRCSPQNLPREVVKSPKRHQNRFSPSHNRRNNLTNSCTSPSLPFAPPLQQNRAAQFASMPDTGSFQHPTTTYDGTYTASQDNAMPVYQQQPYIIYAPYGVPMATQYENRMLHQDPPVQDISGGYFVTDTNIPTQSLPYQSVPTYWGEPQPMVYQSPPSNSPLSLPQRYTVSIPPAQPGSFLPHSYVPACESIPSQNVQSIPPPNSLNTELVPVYSHQPMQIVFSTSSNQSNNAMAYPNQNILYPQNPVCPNMIVPIQNVPPHQHNSCSATNTGTLSGKYPEQGLLPQPSLPSSSYNYEQLTCNMGQLNLFPSSEQQQQQQHIISHGYQTTDARHQRGNKFSTPKNVSSSSQSSTGTSSPAATVVAGYGSIPNHPASSRMTPPQNTGFGYGPNYVQSVILKQMSNVHGGSSINRNSSRSPTPSGSDISHHVDRRFLLPASFLRGVPYVFQNDSSRMVPNRNQTATSKQQSVRHQNMHQNDDAVFKSHRNKKYRGNKTSNLPPNGK